MGHQKIQSGLYTVGQMVNDHARVNNDVFEGRRGRPHGPVLASVPHAAGEEEEGAEWRREAGAATVTKRNQAKTASPNFSKKSEKSYNAKLLQTCAKNVRFIVILITTYE